MASLIHDVFRGDIEAMRVSSKRRLTVIIARLALLAVLIALLGALVVSVMRLFPRNIQDIIISIALFIVGCCLIKFSDPMRPQRLFGFSITDKHIGIFVICMVFIRLAESLFDLWTAAH